MAKDGLIKFEVPGEPVAKGRPRFIRATGHAHTPAKTVNYETRIQEIFAHRFPGFVPLTGPVWLTLGVNMTIPASASKKRRAAMLAHEIFPTKKPDIDNIVKIVGDALNGLAFADDKQIVVLAAAKYYSVRPRLEIEISEIGE